MFISLEGIDGSGKTTQAKLLAEELGAAAVLVREPGGTPAGADPRAARRPGRPLDRFTELLLFCAARAQLIEEVIHPALERDDRDLRPLLGLEHRLPGRRRGLGADYVRQLCNATTGGLWPELTILLWVEPEAALRRTQGDDRFEAEGIEFQRRVAAAYREIAEQEPGRVRLIDAEGSVDQVHKAVMASSRKVTATPTASRPPDPLAEATRHQPRARAELGAALASGPTHAYLFRGPRGSGKAAAARAFAAELLAAGSAEPEEARRRVLLDPSPHPDLVWLRPPGAQHLVDDVREMVIRAASLRPMEGERRVFVIEEAEALRDESQNALLKTLEEPAPFAIWSCSARTPSCCCRRSSRAAARSTSCRSRQRRCWSGSGLRRGGRGGGPALRRRRRAGGLPVERGGAPASRRRRGRGPGCPRA